MIPEDETEDFSDLWKIMDEMEIYNNEDSPVIIKLNFQLRSSLKLILRLKTNTLSVCLTLAEIPV